MKFQWNGQQRKKGSKGRIGKGRGKWDGKRGEDGDGKSRRG